MPTVAVVLVADYIASMVGVHGLEAWAWRLVGFGWSHCCDCQPCNDKHWEEPGQQDLFFVFMFSHQTPLAPWRVQPLRGRTPLRQSAYLRLTSIH